MVTSVSVQDPINATQSAKILAQGLMYKGQTIKLMDVRSLSIDPYVQRTLNKGKAQKIAQDYNEQFLGIFDVSYINKTQENSCSDGQHRKAAIEIRLEKELPVDHMVLCLIKTVNNKAEMAQRFVGKNTAMGVTGNDRFKARLVMDESPEKDINRIVRKHGFELVFLNPGKPSKNEINSVGIRGVAKLLSAYSSSPTCFDNALLVLKKAYAKKGIAEYAALCGEFICGIVAFLTTQTNNKTTLNKIIASLKKTSAEHIRNIVKRDDVHSSKRVKKIAEILAANCNLRIAA